jgi:3-isopropylmalate dehydrogenase
MTKAAYEIAVVAGDGIGPEVVGAALEVMQAAARQVGLGLRTMEYEAGAAYFQSSGQAIGADTLAAIGEADAILFGAGGLPHIRTAQDTEIAPQIDIREHFDLFASLRPVRNFPGVPKVLARGQADLLIVREITEGLFAGRHDPPGNDPNSASDRMTITRAGTERLCQLAFEQAALRRRHVTLMDKANVLRSQAFMRRVFDEVAARHPDIAADHVHIDAGCMLLVTDPGRFDVVVCENQFGDITSEIAAGITGGLGLAPSADVSRSHGVFQPCHGSAPDIAGKGVANPVAAILSGAMLFEWLGQRGGDARAIAAAEGIREAVAAVLAEGPHTADLGGSAGTGEMTRAIMRAATLVTARGSHERG